MIYFPFPLSYLDLPVNEGNLLQNVLNYHILQFQVSLPLPTKIKHSIQNVFQDMLIRSFLVPFLNF